MIRTHFQIPRKELFAPGHSACQGCGHTIITRHVLKAAGENTIVVTPTGCLEVISSVFPYTSWGVPWIHVAFENAGAVASGVEAAIKALTRKGVLKEKPNILVLAGDGGTVDIGFQSFSGMLERGHKVVYILLDNEAYMNTGIQRSGSTPYGAWTTTTPVGKKWKGEWRPRLKKDMTAIAIAHHIPYVATASPSHIVDLYNKVKKALEVDGPAFIHVISPCPTGWKFDPSKTIEVARLAVQTAYWVLYEYDHGEYRVTLKMRKRKPVREFLKIQGRFRHMTEEQIKKFQELIDKHVEEINKLVGEEVIGPVED